jgi:hypothetical protein
MGEHAVLAYSKSVEIEVKVYCSLYVAIIGALHLPQKCFALETWRALPYLLTAKSVEHQGSFLYVAMCVAFTTHMCLLSRRATCIC